jgi:hypothetical protein
VPACRLCTQTLRAEALNRVSGIDICEACQLGDPTEGLQSQGIAVEWNIRLGWFSAGLGLAGMPEDFYLSCVPEILHHKALKWVVHEVEVGDPVFDSRVFVRTSDPEMARALLALEGVQSALLGLLSGVKVNEIVSNHVTLKGPTLTVRVRPMPLISADQVQALKIETSALALLLCGFARENG